jgi:hypothetical protein
MLLVIFPLLVSGTGCARPAGVQDAGAASAEPHQVPFRDGEGTPDSPKGDASETSDNSLGAETGLPFHDPQSLPAGTLLSVRLKSPITIRTPGISGTFEAIVDAPVAIEGNKLVPRGATVVGRVESARTSNLNRNRGYMRLVLDSIHFEGASLPIQTSSLFVRGIEVHPEALREGLNNETPPGDVSQGQRVRQSQAAGARIRLEKGRRLTFRLTESVFVAASQRSKVDR